MEPIKYITNGLKIVKNNFTTHTHEHSTINNNNQKNIHKNIQTNVYNIYNIRTDLPHDVELFLESLDGVDEIKSQLTRKSKSKRDALAPPRRSSMYVKILANFTSGRKDPEIKEFISHQELLEKMGPEFCIKEFVLVA